MQRLVDKLCRGLGLDPVGLDLFELALEEEFAPRVAKEVELFSHTPNLLLLELDAIVSQLLELEGRFAAREEYERCAVVQRYRAGLERKILVARRAKKRSEVSPSKRRA